MEAFKDRLRRFLDGSPNEIFMTILNSFGNFFLREIEAAGEREHYSLMFLGTHAVIQTVAEKIFGLRGRDGTTFYLRNFVDGDTPDRTFSTIADEIHEMRNVKAHQWSSAASHDLAFDYAMREGWRRDGDTLRVNPRVFLEQFLAGFGAGGKIWAFRGLLAPETALVQKYRFLRDWLDLAKGDPIAVEIRKLEDATTTADRAAAEGAIRAGVTTTYGL